MYKKYCEIRDSKGYKNADVSKGTGIAQSTFSDWKNGRSVPKTDKLNKIAKFLGVPVSSLMEGSEYEYDFETHTWYEGPEPENEKVGALSEQEEYLVLQYRDLSEKKKDALLTYLEFLLKSEMGE